MVLPVPAYPRRMKMLALLPMKSIKAVRADCCSVVSVMINPFSRLFSARNLVFSPSLRP